MSFTKASAKDARCLQLAKRNGKKAMKITHYFNQESQKNQTKEARNAKKNKRIVEENNNLKRKIGKLEKDISKSTPTPKASQRSSLSSPSPIDYHTKRLLQEKTTNAKKSKSHRRYSN